MSADNCLLKRWKSAAAKWQQHVPHICIVVVCGCCVTEKPPSTKRLPKGPRAGFTLENVKMETITAIPYDIVKEGLKV